MLVCEQSQSAAEEMFGWFVKVDEEKLGKVRKKCRMDVSAYTICTRAYGKESALAQASCGALRTQVVHCYCRSYCPDVASEYERCYHTAINRGTLLTKKPCSALVAKMEKCLRKQRVFPENL